MVLFNYSTKELTAKIVYYGPGLCGKTTNLQYIFENLPANINKGKMLSLATKTDRTLFFDFLPIDLGTIRNMRTRLQLYTVPGQVFYNTTRKLVLKGADGVVFVADSQKKMLDANVESFKNLEQNLDEHGMKLGEMPHVIQFNKRDLPDVLSTEEMNQAINRFNAPIYEAVATTGIGVQDTLKAVTRLVLNSLREKYGDSRKAAPKAAPVTAAVAAAAVAPPPPAPAAVEEVLEVDAAEEAVIEIDQEPAAGGPVALEAEMVDLEIEPAPPSAEEPLLSLEEPAGPAVLAEVVADEEPALSLQEPELDIEPVHPPPGGAPVDDSSPLLLRSILPEAPAADIEAPFEDVPVEVGESIEEEEPAPLPLAEPEPFEIESASVEPPSAAARESGAISSEMAAAPPNPSFETRAVPLGGGPDQDAGASQEATFPFTVDVGGRPLHLRITISIRIEKP